MRKIILTTLTFLLLLLQATAQRTLIHCGKLIDTKDGKIVNNVTIIVQGNLITDVVNGFTTATTQDKVIDLKNKTVMPGLMDMHVHMESETKKGGAADRFTMNPADVAFQSTVYANTTLMAGFTTVRDLGGSLVNISLRNSINKGLVVGPRIFSAGKSIATTGGHADPTNSYRKDLMGDPRPE